MADVLRCPLLERHGFAHGFSLRTGGVSEGPFASLNLGGAVGDDPDRVEENHRRFARVVGYGPGRLMQTSQVHGAAARRVRGGDEPQQVLLERADALVARDGGTAVGVRVADCVPVLLADPQSGAVAAVHAGWRGCVAGVLRAAVDALTAEGTAGPAALVAAIGPHIRLDAFEVGEDVAEPLERAVPEADPVRRGRGKPHVSLARIARAQLRRAGLTEAGIEDVGGCTFEEPARFFSYRRDGPRSGRHVGAIVARP